MEEIFVSNIDIKKVRHIRNLSIPLSEKERKHLIITGKNGSGKTSVLLEFCKFLDRVVNDNTGLKKNYITNIKNSKKQLSEIEQNSPQNLNERKKILLNHIKFYENKLKYLGEVEIKFHNEKILLEKVRNSTFIIAFFEAKRNKDTPFNIPSSISKINIEQKHRNVSDSVKSSFIQYIVNMKAERSFARDDGDIEYENLLSSNNLSYDNKDKLEELKKYFSHIPHFFFNDELRVKLQEISLKSLKPRKK